jgi:type II secretion system protein G
MNNKLKTGSFLSTIIGHLILVFFIGFIASSCDRNKSASSIVETKSNFQKIVFTDSKTGDTIRLISKTQCEIARQRLILLAEYSREENKLRIVTRVMGTDSVVYYEIITDGLRSPDGQVLLLPEPLKKLHEEERIAKELEVTRQHAAQLEKERQEQIKARALIESGRKNQNLVKIEGGNLNPFFICCYETTWEEWQVVHAYAQKNGYELENEGEGSASNHPVRNVTLCSALKWCNARSEMEGLVPVYYAGGGVYKKNTFKNGFAPPEMNAQANGYRLPSAAEWEWAARGGEKCLGYNCSGSNDPDEVAWHGGNSGGDTHPVGTKKANEMGIYDMNGNVWEWCFDSNMRCSDQVTRGGSFSKDRMFCHATKCADLSSGNGISGCMDYGFRVVRSLDPAALTGRVVDHQANTHVKADFATIRAALMSYRSIGGYYPTTMQGLKALIEKPTSNPIPKMWERSFSTYPLDPWGNAYGYKYPGTMDKSEFEIISKGSDGIEGTPDDISSQAGSVVPAGGAGVVPPSPSPHYIYDGAGWLNEGDFRTLDDEIKSYERETTSQFVVAIFPKIPDGTEMFDFSQQVFDAWKPGLKGKDNGAIFLIFAAEHKVRIQTGRGMEGVLPDASCKQIIENTVVPLLRKQERAGAVTEGVRAMIAAAKARRPS